MSILQLESEDQKAISPIIKEKAIDIPPNKESSPKKVNEVPINKTWKDNTLLKLDLKCFKCNRQFWDNASLESHTKAHIENKIFSCKECGKSYPKLSRLKIHLRTHSGERPFICPIPSCRKVFNENANLKAHVRVHTGEKPFACVYPNCIKKFKTFGQLADHRKVHSEEKKYSCKKCDKKFKRITSLKLHLKSHIENFLPQLISQNEEAINQDNQNVCSINQQMGVLPNPSNINLLDGRNQNIQGQIPSQQIPIIDLFQATKGIEKMLENKSNLNNYCANQLYPNFNPDLAMPYTAPSFNFANLQQLDSIPSVCKTAGNEFVNRASPFIYPPRVGNNLFFQNTYQTQNCIFNPSFIIPYSSLQGTHFNIKQ